MMETIKSLSLTITDMEEIKKKKKIAWNTCIGSLCCFAVFFFFFETKGRFEKEKVPGQILYTMSYQQQR